MRQFVLLLILLGALAARAQSTGSATQATNTIDLGSPGTLEIPTPADWTLALTNMNLSGNPPTVELHAPENTTVIRMTVYWDGFKQNASKPTQADFQNMVSNVCQRQYVAISVEKEMHLETLKGPEVTGIYARFTDAKWAPTARENFRNLTTGMFRCGNVWGNFDLLSGDKDGPQFNAGIKVIESLWRKPSSTAP